jgi:endonuclease YncB( thermonuclease family)
MHDFKQFPELIGQSLDLYYFSSPFPQIFETIEVKVEKVIDGDTIRVKWEKRDFAFPVRFLDIGARELNEGGEDSRKWLDNLVGNKIVDIVIDPNNRVEKHGRLLGKVYFNAIPIGDFSVSCGQSNFWELRHDGQIPNPFIEMKRVGALDGAI